MKVHLFCKCGGEMDAEVDPRGEKKLRRVFWQAHSKPECGECGPHQCRGARKDKDD